MKPLLHQIALTCLLIVMGCQESPKDPEGAELAEIQKQKQATMAEYNRTARFAKANSPAPRPNATRTDVARPMLPLHSFEDAGAHVGAQTPELAPGVSAPLFRPVSYLHGEPVNNFRPRHVYMLTFGILLTEPPESVVATLSGLQKSFGDQVSIVAVGHEPAKTATSGTSPENSGADGEWWNRVGIAVARDAGRSAGTHWFGESPPEHPVSVIIGKQGVIEWIGDPNEAASPLHHIVADTWDREKAEPVSDQSAFEAARTESAAAIVEAIQSGDYRMAVWNVEQLLQRFPQQEELILLRLRFQVQGRMYSEANEVATKLCDDHSGNARMLSEIADVLTLSPMESGPDQLIAERAARRAVELTDSQNARCLEVLARVRFAQQQKEDAVRFQQLAIQHDSAADPERQELMQNTLRDYQTALARPE